MPKEVLALDIDDVLYPCSTRICEYHNEFYGTLLSPSDFNVVNLHVTFGCSPEEERIRMEIFEHQGHTEIGEPLKGSVEAVRLLGESYDLVVVTSRPITTKIPTLKWLNIHFPNAFKEVRICGNHHGSSADFVPKPIACKQLGAVAIVDDQLRHTLACAEEGIQAILFGNYGWNQEAIVHPGVRRASGWHEVCNLLLH